MGILCSSSTQLIEGQSDPGYTIQELDVQVYSDGATSLEYLLEVDINRARINISLPRGIYEDMLVKDDEGLPLDHEADNKSITIDVLGSEQVELSYTTTGLTNKTASTWSISLTLPIEASITLPPEATIIGMTPTPTSITMAGESITITMPSGGVRISYLLGVTGTREHALLLINQAETRIDQAENEGVRVGEAKALLEQAKEAYYNAQYTKAEELATKAENSADETVVLAQEAKTTLETADASITLAQEAGRTSLLDQAREELQQGWEAYNTGNYEEGKAYAEQAAATAQQSKMTRGFFTPQLIAMLGSTAILALIVLLVFARKRMEKGASLQNEGFTVDLDSIFEQHPDLRLDEKEVIRFIAEAGEGVFASEIRERFDLPRSSAWRMINRLEEEEIVRTRIVGRETYAQINPKYELKGAEE